MSATFLARLVAVVWVAIAILVSRLQGDVLPVWIVGLLANVGGSPELSVRLVAGVAVGIAGVVLASGSRARIPAMASCIVLAFSGVADVSARWSLGFSLWPAITPLVVGLALLGLLGRAKDPAGRIRRPGLAVAFGVVAVLVGAGLAANLEVSPLEPPTRPGRDASGRYVVHDLTPVDWEGQSLEETGVLEHLPQLRGLVQGQPTLIAFYRPNCGMCHDLFDAHFGERLPARVVAVRVPPADGVELAENDLPEDVVCGDCVRLAFPEGPVWLIQTPALVEVIDGRVTCVSTEDFHRCVDDAVAAAEAQYEAEAMEAESGA